jgi:[calcium/calmodulin-dependent protein kinase] kinase
LLLNTGIGQSTGPYREERELAFRDIDKKLYNLFYKILIKDPVEHITLWEVKRHLWVICDINDIIRWLEASDLSQKTAGKRI